MVAILNSSGAQVVGYTYDAWGRLLSTTGSMASTLGLHNPLRYRGYVYDTETGLYYLQTRYYNPKWGRFINADGYVSTGQGILGNNMFAYCLNNPVNRVDATGSISLWYYLTVDSDMGFVHRAVVDHIAANNSGLYTEYQLSSFGRADIYAFGIGAVWEVKHASVDPALRAATAALQAYGYYLVNDEVTGLGKAYAFNGTFYIQCLTSSYEVTYQTPFNGVILYTVTETSNYNGEFFRVYVPKTQEKRQETIIANPAPACTPVAAAAVCAGMLFLACLWQDPGLTPELIRR